MNRWKGEAAFARKDSKAAFTALSWLAKAASRDDTRYFMAGIFNEMVDGDRVFVATDGKRLHKIRFSGNPEVFRRVPVGKNLSFRADSKQITLTAEIDGEFPVYKNAIPDIADAAPFDIVVHKASAYTGALYELYSREIIINAGYIAALDIPGSPVWSVYRVGNRALCTNHIADATHTAVFALMEAGD